MLLYLVLKWAHILAAVVIIGAHFSYGFWIVRGSSHPEALPFVLKNIKWLDERVVFPAYAALLLTGLSMGAIAPSVFRAAWLMVGMTLFVLLVIVHLVVYRPALLRMIRALEAEGLNSPALQAAGSREKNVGTAMVLLMALIAFLMVIKPTLWQ